MRVSRHIRSADPTLVLRELLGGLILLGALFFVPFVVSLFFREFLYSQLFGAIAFGSALAGLGGRKLISVEKEMEFVDALIITALSYFVFSLLGAVPFLPILSFLDALFEAMSGFTTTGLTMVNEATLPQSLHFFRAYTQWLGGLGIIVLAMVFLIRSGKSAFKLYSSEFGEQNIMGSVISTAKAVIKVYLILTVAGFIAYAAAGMSSYSALIHIMTTIPTGGFSLYPESIGFYNSSAISLTVSVFMVLGALSFPLYYLAAKGNIVEFFRDHQTRALLVIIIVSAGIFMVSLGPGIDQIAPAVFQSATAITTTGYNTIPTAELPDGDKFLTIALMVIGGGTGSTAGGIKILRLLVLLSFIRIVFFRELLPKEAKLSLQFGNLNVSKTETEAIVSFFLTYLLILIVSTLALIWLEGFSLVDSLFEVASAEGTVGMSVGVTSPSLHPASKLILVANMWLGRLEITPVLVALYPKSWV